LITVKNHNNCACGARTGIVTDLGMPSKSLFAARTVKLAGFSEKGRHTPSLPSGAMSLCEIPRHPTELINGVFMWPNIQEGCWHYATNRYCAPNSPPDTVLLFETKAGWNQHGGPELFTFDNHDPKGGCVLLNDGTVKFIRTEAELGALRWK
jgi:hypothetical protein